MGLFDSIGLRQARTKIVHAEAIGASGIGDKKALTERLNDPSNWKGTDDDNFWMRWRIYVKHWFAFSSRSKQGLTASFVFFPGMYLIPFSIWFTGWSWWYFFPLAIIPVARRWRAKPKILFAKKWGGAWRWENVDATTSDRYSFQENPKASLFYESDGWYLSRIQPFTRGSIALFWPFCVVAYFYPDAKDVGEFGTSDSKRDKEIGFYRGWHFDDDLVFWGDGAAGPHFK